MRIKASVGIDEAAEDRDLEILNAVADHLNREMDDVLAYQVEPWRETTRFGKSPG